MTPPGPTSFLATPDYGSPASKSFYEIQQQQQPIPPPVLPPARPSRPQPVSKPTLSLRYDERGPICELSKELRARLPPLKECDRILLVVPHRRGGQWYLDTRPKPGSGYQIPNSDRAQFRTQPISKIHFMRPSPTLAGTGGRGGLSSVSNTNEAVAVLRFVLGDEVVGHAGYYQLVREER